MFFAHLFSHLVQGLLSFRYVKHTQEGRHPEKSNKFDLENSYYLAMIFGIFCVFVYGFYKINQIF